MSLRDRAASTKAASKKLAGLDSGSKDRALKAVKEGLISRREEIFSENIKDIERSEKENLAAPLLKRLKFDDKKFNEVINGIDSLLKLEDPVGSILSETELDTDLILKRTSCPIGVIGMIFESRPDALVQISTLCLKSGNGVILKGGSEALLTNRILAEVIHNSAVDAGLPEGWLTLAETRGEVNEMLKLDDCVDLIIPRGSNEFVQYIMNNSNIPVLGHADGICHAYIDSSADTAMAVNVVVDSKTQYVAVCNALETLLVHKDKAAEVLPLLKEKFDAKNTELRGCSETRKIIDVAEATVEDWATEYLDYILSIKIVEGMDEAIDHIHKYGSGHTETIITSDAVKAEEFLNSVDSGDVFWNCSTRFSDGFRYGLGAEVGISTNKIHARGPVGMEGLLIYKWKLYGNGNIVSDYSEGRRSFTHKKIK